MISKKDAIQKAWEQGSDEQKRKLSRYRMLMESFAFNAICIYEENDEDE